MIFITPVLGIIGIIGGLLCATADLLLDLKGTKNKKLGKMGVIDSEWENMAHWRFVLSDILAMFAVPIASRLMKTAHNLAGGEKDIAVYLIANENAVPFYEKLGMKKSDDVMQYNHIEWTEWTVE
ncbi:DUF6796 family protein [Butyrivibrio sp. AE3004]|uniref:DUF6796 family protein n=1 Tax=Butyrivibrio sp. AE3004 TaxID=1506994 RepID=UPI000494B9F9|nr:DUF6796 family protein [Butyrivibrio sp. AE3004]